MDFLAKLWQFDHQDTKRIDVRSEAQVNYKFNDRSPSPRFPGDSSHLLPLQRRQRLDTSFLWFINFQRLIPPSEEIQLPDFSSFVTSHNKYISPSPVKIHQSTNCTLKCWIVTSGYRRWQVPGIWVYKRRSNEIYILSILKSAQPVSREGLTCTLAIIWFM